MAMARNALLVIDMQNGFCDPYGSFARMGRDTTRFAAPIGPLERLVDTARQASVPIFYTVHQYRRGYPEAGLQMERVHPMLTEVEGLVEGTWDAEIVPQLQPAENDVVVSKTRYDAFLNTDLDLLLQRGRISSLIVGGISTNVCVESTVRSAAQRDLQATVVEDCVAASSDDLHQNALASMAYAFAEVVDLSEALSRLS